MVQPGQSSFYEILGVEPNATPRRIRSAYLTLIKRHHPDAAKLLDGRDGGRSAAINEAFSTLKDARRRARYDDELRRLGQHPVHLESREKPAGTRRGHAPAVRTGPVGIPESPLGDNATRRPHPGLATGLCLVILALGLAIIDIGQQPGQIATAAKTNDTGLRPDSAGLEPPILPAIVADSVMDFLWLKSNASADDAMQYSRNCFSQLGELPSLRLADRCIAFDIAWQGELANRQDSDRMVARGFFSGEQLRARHRSVLQRFTTDSAGIDARREAIARVTVSELSFAMQPAGSRRDADGHTERRTGPN